MPEDGSTLEAIALLILVVGGMALALLGVTIPLIEWWSQASAAGCPVPLGRLLAMRLRRAPVSWIMAAYIRLHRSGRPTDLDHVERTWRQHAGQIRSAEDLAHWVLRDDA